MYKLIIEDDEGKTTVVPLIRDEITIGRKEGNTIRLTERNVSRRHAKLSKANGTVYIEDLQSYNGIRVNGDRIAGRAPITEGDRVQIGDYQLALKLDKSAPAPDHGDDGVDKTTPFIKPGPGEDMRAPPDAPTRASPIITSAAPTSASATISGPGESAMERPARLVVVSSNFAGKEFKLDKAQCVIGRTDENDVVVNHRSISRHHAKIVRENGRYQVVDLGSANGVRVNGEDYGKVELRKGDLLDLGHVRLRFVAPNEDFVFARDAQVVDVAAGEKKSPVKMIVAGLAVLVVVGGVAVVALKGTGGDKPQAASAGGSKLGELNLEVDKAIASLEWDSAVAKATEGLGIEPNNSLLRDKKAKAESEKKAQVIYDQYSKAAKAGDNETAVLRYQEIPEPSVYHEKAQETWPVLKRDYIRDHLEKARSLQGSNNCGEAKKHVEAVLMVDDANTSATEIANKCGQPVAAPRPRSGGTSSSTPRPSKPTSEHTTAKAGSEPTPPATPVKPQPVVERTPAPTPPALPPPNTGDEEMRDANDAYIHGEYQKAADKARAVLKKDPGNTRAWRLFGGSSCFLKDKTGASTAWNHLGSIERKFLQYVCQRNGIALP